MGKVKQLFTNWRILLLIIVIIMSVWAIQPSFGKEGVYVKAVDKNSTAEVNGIEPGFIITQVNGKNIETLADYKDKISEVEAEQIVRLKTDEGDFSLLADEKDSELYLGVNVQEIPTSNLRKGLDLVGGARVILEPNKDITDEQLEDVITLIERRLNVYGISDVVIRPVKDLEGDKFILVEVAGATKEEVTKLVAQQGKFEAKIGNESIFVGGEDIKAVCRSADCSGIDLRTCGQDQEGTWGCRFQFRVDVSQASAETHAEVTSKLGVITEGGDRYLSEKLDLYLDDELVESLLISEDLQGQVSTSFVIQGPGLGTTKEAATQDALLRMKEFQTLLITGSLPVSLEVAKIDIVSPTLGANFFQSTLLALVIALVAIASFLMIRYKNWKIAVPIWITGVSELIIILGFAAAIRWNLDLAALAGILAAVGTGVDHQIVITDEVMKGSKDVTSDWKKKISRAFFIIFAAYFTTLVALIPLGWIGTGLLKGFALTTIVGVSIGVFITRPAYAKVIEILMK